MHGGTNKGAPQSNRNAWKHGNRSAEAEDQLKILSRSNRNLKLIQKLENGHRLSQAEHDRLLTLYAESLGED